MIQVARIHRARSTAAGRSGRPTSSRASDNIPGIAKGSFALYVKFHHAGVDGEAGARSSRPFIPCRRISRMSRRQVTGPSLPIASFADRTLFASGRQLRQVFDAASAGRRSGRARGAGWREPCGDRARRSIWSRAWSPGSWGKRRGAGNKGAGRLGRSKPGTTFRPPASPHRVVDAECWVFVGWECRTIREYIDGITINDIFMAGDRRRHPRISNADGNCRRSLKCHGADVDARKQQGDGFRQPDRHGADGLAARTSPMRSSVCWRSGAGRTRPKRPLRHWAGSAGQADPGDSAVAAGKLPARPLFRCTMSRCQMCAVRMSRCDMAGAQLEMFLPYRSHSMASGSMSPASATAVPLWSASSPAACSDPDWGSDRPRKLRRTAWPGRLPGTGSPSGWRPGAFRRLTRRRCAGESWRRRGGQGGC